MHGKSVILSPYEQTASIYGLELLPLDFWNKLALRLKQKGFFVFTNCNGKTEKPIGGTIVFFPKMGELAGAVEYAGYCVSMRSGFADWISSANLKREVLLYPTRRYFEYYSIKMLWGKDSVLEFIYGKTKQCIKVNGNVIIFKDSVFIIILMEDNIQENGKIIKCMDMENLFGLKVKNI